jgi:ATP cone domain
MPRGWYDSVVSFTVLKADGTSEYFKVEKLRRSLRRAGANPNEIADIIRGIELHLYDGMRTQEIYRLAFDMLRNIGVPAATRYALRRALLGLGPTGFPFEQFLGRLFAAEGYSTKTGIILQGHCAPHEIDIAAYKADHSFIGEAKFHSRPGIKTDLQVAMYSYARLLDLRDQKICQDDICGVKEFWLITNTKFTTTAEEYGTCVGITMLSWDYPRKNNLHDRIQRCGIYPITVLQSLTHQQIQTLIEHEVILCSDIVAMPQALGHLHLGPKKAAAVIAEAEAVGKRHGTSA